MKRLQARFKSLIENKNISELIKFGVVGVLNTSVDFLVFSAMCYGLGVYAFISQALGYSFGVINSFILNKNWTFKKQENMDFKSQLGRFILINGVSLIASMILINVLVNDLYVEPLVSKAIVTILTQFINYIGYKLIVFK